MRRSLGLAMALTIALSFAPGGFAGAQTPYEQDEEAAPSPTAPSAPTGTAAPSQAPTDSAPPDPPPPATAEPVVAPPDAVDTLTRDKARTLAEEGLMLYDSGKYAEALVLFERAGSLVQAPTMGLMAARALSKLGRLVEAKERYSATARMKLEGDASPAFKAAQEEAGSESLLITSRIPKLILMGGSLPPGTRVSLDGRPIGAKDLDTQIQVDPGSHTLDLSKGGIDKSQRIELKEAESKRVVLTLDPEGAQGPKGVKWTMGWISLGIAAATGIASAILTPSFFSSLSEFEASGRADASLRVKTVTFQAASSVTGMMAIATGALGVGLLLTAKNGPVPKTHASVSALPGEGAKLQLTVRY